MGIKILANGQTTLFNELILNEYTDEYKNKYYYTKGFNRYYLYKQSTYPTDYGYNYNMVACGKLRIKSYIKENKLEEIK